MPGPRIRTEMRPSEALAPLERRRSFAVPALPARPAISGAKVPTQAVGSSSVPGPQRCAQHTLAIRPDNPHVELASLWAPHACDIWVYPSASPAPRKYHYSSSLVLAAGRGRARHGRETGP
jgi:hypothetical protein